MSGPILVGSSQIIKQSNLIMSCDHDNKALGEVSIDIFEIIIYLIILELEYLFF